jgi:hypothetical protein
VPVTGIRGYKLIELSYDILANSRVRTFIDSYPCRGMRDIDDTDSIGHIGL